MCMMNPMANDLEQLRGEVERLVYSSEESGFTICRLVVPGRGDLVTVAGTMPGIQPGERLHLRGRWINHPVHGYQFRADSYSSQLPASANAVRRYLASSLVKGIGPVLAGRLVDCFGEETLRVIDEQPERLAEAPGVGPRRLESIKRAWEEQQEIRGVMLFLQGHGVSAAYSTRIYKTYGQDAVGIVQENPYRNGPPHEHSTSFPSTPGTKRGVSQPICRRNAATTRWHNNPHWRDKRTRRVPAPAPAQVQEGRRGQGIPIGPEQGRLEGIKFPAHLAFSDKRETARATLIQRI